MSNCLKYKVFDVFVVFCVLNGFCKLLQRIPIGGKLKKVNYIFINLPQNIPPAEEEKIIDFDNDSHVILAFYKALSEIISLA